MYEDRVPMNYGSARLNSYKLAKQYLLRILRGNTPHTLSLWKKMLSKYKE